MEEAVVSRLFGDKETWEIIGRSLWFSLNSTLFSLLPGLPLGLWLARSSSRFARYTASFVNSLTALPTVVIGLMVYTIISRSGPLGFLGLLFAPPGVVIGQAFLALPIVASLIYAGLSKLDERFIETIITLGAGRFMQIRSIMREAKTVFATALVTAFGRVTGEVGVSMMLGGNIRGSTRTMTTSIALDTAKGEFERALVLGLVLLIIAMLVNLTVYYLRSYEK
jgi:tungstate transport system permease protein